MGAATGDLLLWGVALELLVEILVCLNSSAHNLRGLYILCLSLAPLTINSPKIWPVTLVRWILATYKKQFTVTCMNSLFSTDLINECNELPIAWQYLPFFAITIFTEWLSGCPSHSFSLSTFFNTSVKVDWFIVGEQDLRTAHLDTSIECCSTNTMWGQHRW